ncbi:MAG: 50S ribosomal protein L29 [Methanobacteriaceae archaeon]|jgi:large subunit ribosomal protein L29|uniref:50S ribosomal protein L29 n=1 Tax=unclassified Methanobrevibacter TaxID=2638681 RepID=UPI002A0D1A47|nr:50S ribosomal protein L29 [Methanobacteriaceae archaeon]MDD3408098.1 50S ribosomal protein L29 [Methanobacteriaceae archaeon]MDD4593859.1 50S ribosomal protein L29 [Methanobacteriaceae archaeon]
MAILRSNEIWEMEIEEIQEKLIELKVELNKTVSKGAAAGVIDNPGQVRELKRTIARVLTIMSQKQKEN